MYRLAVAHSAVHVLLINLATDSLPAVALGIDPADTNVMKQKPVRSGTLFEKGMIYRIVLHDCSLRRPPLRHTGSGSSSMQTTTKR